MGEGGGVICDEIETNAFSPDLVQIDPTIEENKRVDHPKMFSSFAC